MIEIDLDSPVPLVDQVVAEIRRAIATGQVRPQDELPAVRQLAGDLGINFNTVARAYRSLESSGLVRSKRGRGTCVVAGVEPTPQRNGARILQGLRGALVDARLGGWRPDEILDTVRLELASLYDDVNQET